MRNVVNAIELILTNQRNDFLIQWKEGKTRQPKSYKDKLYAEIRYQITSNAIREIHKQFERIKVAAEKQEPLPACITSFRETMQLPCTYEIDYLISQKKSIPLEDVHWHWRFIRCPVWDSRRNRSPEGPNANPSPQQVGATLST